MCTGYMNIIEDANGSNRRTDNTMVKMKKGTVKQEISGKVR